MNWQLISRNKDRELNDQERRHLGAVKLFIESVDSRHAWFAESLDKMPPRGQRELINSYHSWLEDPNAFKWSQRLGDWPTPFIGLRNAMAKILSRLLSVG